DGFVEFDLSLRDLEVIGAELGVSVSYHLTQSDADMGVAALPTLYTNVTAGAQVVYVRLTNDATGCYDTVELQLIVNPLPLVSAVADYALCDDNNPGDEQELFDLGTKDIEAIGGQANVTVTYYATLADAQSGSNALAPLYANTSNPETIYYVLANGLTGCSSIGTFDLVVNELPQLVVPTPLEVCDDNVIDGLTEIDLTLKNTEISGNNPSYLVSYYLTQADADSGTNPLPALYTNITNPQTVYVLVEDIASGCSDTTSLLLDVQQAPAANVPMPLYYCDPDNDGFGLFNLEDATLEVTGGAAGLAVTYHETQANAENGVDAIDTSVDYNNIVEDAQVIYVRVESATIATNCATVVALQLIVEPTPQIVEPTPLEECDDISADGFALFDLTSKDSEILGGLDPLQYTVTYHLTPGDAELGTNPIATPGAFTNTENPQTIYVRVEDTSTVGGCYKTTELILIVNPLPVLTQPGPLELCDVNNPGDEQEAFTLEDANAEILNGQTGITLTYYETQLDADNGTNPIASPYTNTMNAQTIYVRAVNDVTGCVNTITVTLRVNPIPSPEPDPDPIVVCDDDNDGIAEFNLEERTVEIINGELDVVITYHETEADANDGLNALGSPYTNIVPNTQQIYVRSENQLTGCYSLTLNTLELQVVPSPEVPVTLEDYVICDTDDNGFAQFDLTTKLDEILGSQDPADVVVTFHLTQGDADNGANPIATPGAYTNATNPQVIYVRAVSAINGCVSTGEFIIRVELPPTAVQPTPLELCDDFDVPTIPNDEVTVFDLTLKDGEITGGNASWSVAYYETLADAQAQANAIPDPTMYTNTSVGGNAANPQTLYAVVTDTDTGCTDMVTLTIRVLPNPTPTETGSIPDLELCDDVNTGDMTEVFDLTENELLVLNGEAGVSASYYETVEDAILGSNAIADPTSYDSATDPDNPEQTIYIRVTNGDDALGTNGTGCFTVVSFTIRVNPLPAVVAVPDFVQCELNNDGVMEFDLATKDAEVLNGQDPSLFTVTYHETQADADDLMNALVSPYTNTGNPQTIYVAITNNDTGCSISTVAFALWVHEDAQANPDDAPITLEACDDNVETDGDPSNDSVQFDLSLADAQVLDGQDPANYIVSYYASLDDADNGVNPLPTLYENITNPQTVYVRVDNDTPGVVGIALDLSTVATGLDFNSDGTVDTYDTDGDGTFDLVDVDGDGLSDALDTNADGIIDFIDIDGDGQGDLVDLDNDGQVDNQGDSSDCYALAEITLDVNPLPVFDLEDSYTLCVDTNGTEILDPLVLDTGLSEALYSFQWSLNGVEIAGATGSSYAPAQGGTYSVVVTDTSTSTVTMCSWEDSTEVSESAPPTIEIVILSQAFSDPNVIEATATGIGEYEYSLDNGPWQDSGVFTGVTPGEHTVVARDKNGCGIVAGTITVLDYPLFFTPNGDGYNDKWMIPGLDANAKIYIFDRYGKLLKQLNPQGSGWDGTYNGELMPTND
ncbi:T9SS type B sorting domain-containing protein, partial [Winogradskyella sp. 3972H.M.0a.05]|uniref:T9SS type B sorting domain-containing protein n=1 Tax=Winogradskyella sp. 3972H.M.0a.05 TaxID=2950277 RepID=UPI003393960E